MPTLDELERALRAADAAGNTSDAARLARAYRAAKEQLSQPQRQTESGSDPGRASPEDRLRQFRRELADWEVIKNSKNPQDYYAYLDKYPSGYISEQAQFRLDQLTAPGVEVVPGPGYPKPLPSGTRRYEVGDETVYDFIDKLTGITNRAAITVTFADDERAEFNNGVAIADQMGGVIRDPGSTKTPPRLIAPADLAVGKRWQTAFHNKLHNGFEENVTWDYRVEAFESVTVPAGTIRAFRVEGRGFSSWISTRGAGRLKETRWIDPTVMRSVRWDSEYRKSNGDIDQYSTAVLVRISLAPRAPRTAR